MSRTLVSTRVVEQVVLVVPLAVVPLFKRGELGDDRSAFEAVSEVGSRGRMVSRDIKLDNKQSGMTYCFSWTSAVIFSAISFCSGVV